MFDIWNQKVPLAEEVYHSDNYQIVYNSSVDNNECVIYFSSHNIWFPNTEDIFRKKIVENDHYEWNRNPYRVGRKNIYLRDIYKSWYVQGINDRINSVDAIIDWLKKETAGYEVVCIGSSAGGYMAALVGVMLNAKLVFAFSAQFCLYDDGYYNLHFLLQKYRTDADKEKYYDITDMVNRSQVPILYLYPNKCQNDQLQAEKIRSSETVMKYGLNSPYHGTVVCKCNLPVLLNMSVSQLRTLVDHDCRSVFKLSIQLSGIFPTIRHYFSPLYRTLKRKLGIG